LNVTAAECRVRILHDFCVLFVLHGSPPSVFTVERHERISRLSG